MRNKSNKVLKDLALEIVVEGLKTYGKNQNLSEEVLDHLWNIPIFVKNTRKATTFGTYSFIPSIKGRSKIEVYPQNFKYKKIEDFRDTVLHELSHHIAYIIYGPDVGHGLEWKEICRIVGCDATATSDK